MKEIARDCASSDLTLLSDFLDDYLFVTCVDRFYSLSHSRGRSFYNFSSERRVNGEKGTREILVFAIEGCIGDHPVRSVESARAIERGSNKREWA